MKRIPPHGLWSVFAQFLRSFTVEYASLFHSTPILINVVDDKVKKNGVN